MTQHVTVKRHDAVSRAAVCALCNSDFCILILIWCRIVHIFVVLLPNNTLNSILLDDIKHPALYLCMEMILGNVLDSCNVMYALLGPSIMLTKVLPSLAPDLFPSCVLQSSCSISRKADAVLTSVLPPPDCF